MGFDIKDNVLIKYHEEPGITAVSVPDGVTVIDSRAFYNCDRLKLIYLPDSVTEIGNLAFAFCRSLTGILLPDSVTTIGRSAFTMCSSLISIEIPASVTDINGNPFSQCENLKRITVDRFNRVYDSRNGCNAIIQTETDSLVCGCRTTVIPEDIRTIGCNSFSGCKGLTEIKIPGSVTKIESYAFSGCKGLTELKIPGSVTKIGSYAFSGCKGLTEIELPESVTQIDCCAFDGCVNLKEMTVNGYVDLRNIGIDPELFTKLETIYYINPISDVLFWEVPYFISGLRKHPERYPLRSVKEFLPLIFSNDDIETLHIIADAGKIDTADFYEDYFEPANQAGAFECAAFLLNWKHENIHEQNDDIEALLDEKLDADPFNEHDMAKVWRYSVKDDGTIRLNRYKGCDESTQLLNRHKDDGTMAVPARIGDRTVTAIGNYAFENNISITDIIIPDSVTEIDDRAFAKCRNLRSVTIPPSVTYIGDHGFAKCRNLESVTIPPSVTRIENRLFFGCENLRSVTIPPSVTHIGAGAFVNCVNLVTVTIPDTVTQIGEHAFFNCEKLESITLPAGVKEIGDSTFCDCYKLKNITMTGVEKICDRAFRQCIGITTLTFPDTLTTIGRFSINELENLKELNIPASVTSIGRQVYLNDKKIEKISIDKSNPVYNSGDGCNAIIETGSHTLIFACDSTVIPDTVTTIGMNAFSNCGKITEINIPPSVTTIENGAFEYCENLRNVIIPSSVTSIDGHLFTGCRQLKEVFIPDSVTDIGEFLFGIYNETGKILCHKNSHAEKYAKKNGIEYGIV